MSGRTIHVAISVDIDRFDDRYIRRSYGDVFVVDGKRVKEPREIRALCADYRARGFKVFPPCDNTRPDGMCAGHEEPGTAS